MNYLGYNKDNFVEGDSGIDNGTLRINNYILPSEAGTAGQVLTMDANNQNTSFQDNASGSMTRIGAGENNTVSIPATTLGVTLLPSFLGVKIVDIKNIPPGSSYIIEAVSALEFTYDGTSPTVQSFLGVNLNLTLGGTSTNTITVNNQSNPNVYPSPVVIGSTYRANWYYKAVITRNFNGNAFYISTFSTMNRFGNQNYIVNMPTSPAGAIFFTIDGDQNDTTIEFDLTADQALGAGTIVRFNGPSINWYVSQLDEVNPPTLLTNDHTLLSNLNSGDAGHTQFPLLNGRSGGQILSGGITPLHFLTLKAHNAGLNNIVIKDLNTTFEKNIDMDNNEIKNVSVIDNLSGSIDIDSNLTRFLASGVPQGQIDAVQGWVLTNNLDLSNNNIINVNDVGSNRVLTDTLESQLGGNITVNNTINMNTNDIIDANVIVRASNGNVIDMDNDILPPFVTGALTIDSGAGKQARLSAGAILELQGNIIDHNSGTGNHQFSNVAGGNLINFTGTEIDVRKLINMNNNNIGSCSEVSSNGVLNLQGALGNRVDIGVGGSGRMEIEDTRVFISQFANFEIGSSVIYVRANEMPSFFAGDTTYIFIGSRNTSNSYNLPDNCKICGLGKNNSFINYNGGGSLFTNTDGNVSICDITLTSSNNAGILLTASNVGLNKTINFTGLQIRNSKNVMDITGYDLIDFNNCIFTYIETGSASPIGVKITNASKVQLSSTEFLRWFQEGGTPNLTAFTGNMLEFVNVLNALNINGCFFHPQYNQNGIDLSAVSSVIEGTISSNTFIDINLNTPTYNVLTIPPTIATSYVIEANSIYPNLKSQMTYILSAVNTTATDLSVNNPNVINHNNLALPIVGQFATITTGGLITYTKKRSANFMIVATCNIELVAGTNNRIGLGLFVNGAEVPLAYSYVNLSASGTANQKSATLSFTGLANQNDTFQLSVFNATASNNVIVNDINFAGIEI